MSSGPIQRSYGEPHWGSFFTTMTALPATAFRYVTASGHNYAATRVHPINQTNNPDATTDDGLVDATYFFTVPISNRKGTIIISASRTTGVEYQGFVGNASVPLNVGGPFKIPLSFPKNLSIEAAKPRRTDITPGTTFAGALNLVATLLAAALVAFVTLVRRRKRRGGRPVPVVVMSENTVPQSPAPTVAEQRPVPQPRPSPQAAPLREQNSVQLRVDVLGPLTISPTFSPASDPVRAIVAFLAMNNDRILTLEEIQNAVWPLTDAGTDIKKPAMRNYMVDARKTVGERHLPTASGRPGYQLQDFDTDWNEFQRLALQAATASAGESMTLRRQALDLVKGLPFTADTTRYFTWTFSSSIVYKIVEAVTNLAHALATQMVLTADLAGAQVALRQGLLTDPASLTLWEDLTDVLLESADPSLLTLHWKAADLVLRSEDVVLLRNRENG